MFRGVETRRRNRTNELNRRNQFTILWHRKYNKNILYTRSQKQNAIHGFRFRYMKFSLDFAMSLSCYNFRFNSNIQRVQYRYAICAYTQHEHSIHPIAFCWSDSILELEVYVCVCVRSCFQNPVLTFSHIGDAMWKNAKRKYLFKFIRLYANSLFPFNI